MMSGKAQAPDGCDAICELIGAGDFERAAEEFQRADLDPDATRALFGRISGQEAAGLVAALSDLSKAREVLLWLAREQSGPILGHLEPARAASLLAALPSDERADQLSALDEGKRGAIQAALPPDARADAARLLTYPPDTAGGLMETEFLSYPAGSAVSEVIRDIRSNQEKYAAIGVQYVYLVDEGGRLAGVAPIRDLMLAPERAVLSTLVRRAPATVRDTLTTREVAAAFDEHPFMALPVVNEAGVMLGVVTRADATESEHKEAEDDFRVSLGIVGGEELRSLPVATRLRRRSAWLGVNLVLCLAGAAIVAAHQDTLARALVVAAMLPVISATSGNAAMQAAGVSIRELTLGIIDPGAWRRVLLHELALASLLSVPLGTAVGVLARAWGAPWTIGLAVGLAMAFNALVAIGIGAACPLVLRKLRIDPALASGPITTTLADVSGFALTLTFVALAAA